jgi:hypothetical protein
VLALLVIPAKAGPKTKARPKPGFAFTRAQPQSAATMLPMLLTTRDRRNTASLTPLAGQVMLRDHARHG